MKSAMLIAFVECDDGNPYSRWCVLIAAGQFSRTVLQLTQPGDWRREGTRRAGDILEHAGEVDAESDDEEQAASVSVRVTIGNSHSSLDGVPQPEEDGEERGEERVRCCQSSVG